MGANFTPTFGAYSSLTPFRYWCQKVLPLVYDDSLSYYELLNKVVDYLNKTMEDVETLHDDTEAMLAAFNQLQTYVNTYFDELDLTEQVQIVLDRMAENGSLDELLRPIVGEQIGGVVAEQIDDAVAGQIYNTVAEQINSTVIDVLNGSTVVQNSVEGWLNEHIPTGDIVVDNTLSISRAAADAATVGNTIGNQFSIENNYTKDDYVLYNGVLYRFMTDHVAGAWTGTDATAVKIGVEIGDLESVLDDILEFKESTNLCNPDALVVGLLNASGVVDSSYTTRLTTEFIPVAGTYVSAYCHQTGYSDIGGVRVAFYNNDKTLKNIITTSPAITLPTDGASFVRVSFASGWAYYFVGFSINNEKLQFEEYYPMTSTVKENALPSRITATDNWIYKFVECSFVGGNVHLSIDDVSSALYELVSNPPTSIWDTSFFGQLKTWHDTYGVCITCNCFSFLSTLANYDIANIPNTWASEFVAAKSWLKFAFHAKNNNTTYNTATTLKTDYQYFVSAIYHMTGDYGCIDTGTRLQSYAGTEAQIVETMAVEHGITMLWTAEDERNSYYFDNTQTARVNNRCKYIDDVNNILFIRSMPRLDNHTIDDITELISTKPQYGKMVEIFCHENLEGTIASGTITRVNNALAWFNINGYESHFLTEIFI